MADLLLPADERDRYIGEWWRWLADLRDAGMPRRRRLAELSSILLVLSGAATCVVLFVNDAPRRDDVYRVLKHLLGTGNPATLGSQLGQVNSLFEPPDGSVTSDPLPTPARNDAADRPMMKAAGLGARTGGRG